MSKHYGHESSADKALNLDFWLIVGRAHRPSVRVVADWPAKLERHEVCMNLKLKLPIALFERPSLVATINVAAPGTPVEIDTSAVAEAVRDATGLDIDLRVVGPGE